MEEDLAQFLNTSIDPCTSLARWMKTNNRKVIGFFPMHIPEEIIHASGMLPVIMWRGNEPVTVGHSHIPPTNCRLTRSFVDDAVNGCY